MPPTSRQATTTHASCSPTRPCVAGVATPRANSVNPRTSRCRCRSSVRRASCRPWRYRSCRPDSSTPDPATPPSTTNSQAKDNAPPTPPSNSTSPDSGGIPTNAAAATINVTAVDATAPGFLTVYPCDTPMPLASSLNYTTGATIPNELITKLSNTGTICIYTLHPTDLIVDTTGWLPNTPNYTPLVPARLLDTRPGNTTIDNQFAGQGQRPANSTLELHITGRGGIPTNAAAAAINVTAVDATAPGFLTVYPCDTPMPLASSLNYTTGATIPNELITKLSNTGTICIYTLHPTDLIVDTTGWLPNTPNYTPLVPGPTPRHPTRQHHHRQPIRRPRTTPRQLHPRTPHHRTRRHPHQRSSRHHQRHRRRRHRTRLPHRLPLRHTHATRLQPQLHHRRNHPQRTHHQTLQHRHHLHLHTPPHRPHRRHHRLAEVTGSAELRCISAGAAESCGHAHRKRNHLHPPRRHVRQEQPARRPSTAARQGTRRLAITQEGSTRFELVRRTS